MRKILSMLLCLVLVLSCASGLSEGVYEAVLDDKAGLLSAEEAEKVAAGIAQAQASASGKQGCHRQEAAGTASCP